MGESKGKYSRGRGGGGEARPAAKAREGNSRAGGASPQPAPAPGPRSILTPALQVHGTQSPAPAYSRTNEDRASEHRTPRSRPSPLHFLPRDDMRLPPPGTQKRSSPHRNQTDKRARERTSSFTTSSNAARGRRRSAESLEGGRLSVGGVSKEREGNGEGKKKRALAVASWHGNEEAGSFTKNAGGSNGERDREGRETTQSKRRVEITPKTCTENKHAPSSLTTT
ncbi:hypothetical protein B0H10DRAFT_2205567 [Mycena sp. CBHHK59/15]|nr:hypothetical protein B0H10DRAFT_2205567 [Mycena sp. CBHHK59/15]